MPGLQQRLILFHFTVFTIPLITYSLCSATTINSTRDRHKDRSSLCALLLLYLLARFQGYPYDGVSNSKLLFDFAVSARTVCVVLLVHKRLSIVR